MQDQDTSSHEPYDEKQDLEAMDQLQPCNRCGYEGDSKYRPRWDKVLCGQCNLDFDSPSQEVLEGRMGTNF